MAEITSHVYDVVHPTPVSLKQLSAIAISIEIWRREVDKYRSSGKLAKFNSCSRKISLETALPYSPSVIYNLIEKYVTIFGHSMANWLISHYRKVFRYHHGHPYCVLQDFHDFVGDYNGTIHYVRTAERMMRCDRLDETQKFGIACTYFFEDDIRRMWPSVCEILKPLHCINFSTSPQLFYWICRLKDELNKISIRGNLPVDDMMLNYFMCHNRPSVEYFWFKIPSDQQLQKALDFCWTNEESFIRFILPKLDHKQLTEFVNIKGSQLINALLWRNNFYEEDFILRTWNYIRNMMNENSLRDLVEEMLKTEAKCCLVNIDDYAENWLYLCCEIWNSVADNLKQSTVRDILSDHELFEVMGSPFHIYSTPRDIEFLSTILKSVTSEERNTFWLSCWHYFVNTTRGKDLQLLSQLCFENDDEIAYFKECVVAKSETFRLACDSCLKFAHFYKLNDLVGFCCPDVRAAKNFKQLLLSPVLSQDQFFTSAIFDHVEDLKMFIDGAGFSADFKSQLMSSPEIRKLL